MSENYYRIKINAVGRLVKEIGISGKNNTQKESINTPRPVNSIWPRSFVRGGNPY